MPPAPADTAAPGGASRTLDRAMWQSAALGLAVWQLALGALVAWRTPGVAPAVLALHLVFAIAAVPAVLRDRAPRWLYFAALTAVLAADHVLTTDDLAVTVMCMTSVVLVTTFLVMAPGTALAVTAASATSLVVAALATGAGSQVALALAVVPAAFSLGAWAIITVLRRFTASADESAAEAERQRDALAAEQTRAQTATEYARTLHDTLINTLGALASGHPSLANDTAVRQRCAQDVAAMRTLVDGAPRGARLEEVAEGRWIEVAWTGMGATERDDLIERLGPTRAAALRGIVHELLLNVEKHARTDRACVDVGLTGGALVVTVSDAGCGFDPVPRPGRGIAESVLGRAASAGMAVDLDTRPGSGTRVTVTCPLAPSDSPSADELDNPAAATEARRIALAGTWAWCGGVTVASLVVVAVGGRTPSAVAAIGLVALLSAVAWWRCRHGESLPRSMTLALAGGTAGAFVLASDGALASGAPEFWPGIGITPLLVVLLIVGGGRSLTVGLVGLGVGTAVATSRTADGVESAVVVANALTQVAQVGVWVIFRRILATIAEETYETRARAARDRAARAALESARATRARWSDAGLHAAVDLLAEIASGDRLATDPQTQRQAGRHEHFLRQLLLMQAELVHLGPWLARALGEAQERDVHLVLRLGERDVPDASSAAEIGERLLTLVRSTPAGTRLTVAALGQDGGREVTVVGPEGFAADTPSDSSLQRVTIDAGLDATPRQDLVALRGGRARRGA